MITVKESFDRGAVKAPANAARVLLATVPFSAGSDAGDRSAPSISAATRPTSGCESNGPRAPDDGRPRDKRLAQLATARR